MNYTRHRKQSRQTSDRIHGAQDSACRAVGLTPAKHGPRRKAAKTVTPMRLGTCYACGAYNPTQPNEPKEQQCHICGNRIRR